LWHQKRYENFIGIGIADAHNIQNSIVYVVRTCDSDNWQVVVPLLVPQVRRATRNSELAMGRKAIGRRSKSGTYGSRNAASKRQLLQPNEVRADHYGYGAANQRLDTRKNQSTTSLNTNFDDDADDDAATSPKGLKLKAVVVGGERFLFGQGTSIETGKDCILKAVLQSGETADERVAALVMAMSDAGLHQLVREFLLKNQAMIEAASPGMHSYMHSSPEETASSPGSPLNPQRLFPPPPNHVAVAVGGNAAIEVPLTPELQTRHQEEAPTRNHQRRQNRQASILKLTQTDSLDKDSFDFQRNGVPRKNASGKAGQMAKSRQITRIRNAILDYSLNQSQQILALHEAANHPTLRTIMKKPV
jgi:hypothetical protein